MSKKLPDIYKSKDNITSNNKKSYYSFSNSTNKNEIEVEKMNKEPLDTDNFFQYFNRSVEIDLIDNTTIKTKILSKLDNRILIENGTYIELESVNDNCATFRILIQNDGGYTATDNFFIINLNCVGSMKCLGDTLITNI